MTSGLSLEEYSAAGPGGRHDRIRVAGLNGAAETDITIRGGNFVVSL
jgi:hypothetical protein